MSPIIKNKLLDYLHQQTCPYCGNSLLNVNINIVESNYNPTMFICDNTNCDKEDEYILEISQKWLQAYPYKVFQDIERLRSNL